MFQETMSTRVNAEPVDVTGENRGDSIRIVRETCRLRRIVDGSHRDANVEAAYPTTEPSTAGLFRQNIEILCKNFIAARR